jgi:hypothetical protein
MTFLIFFVYILSGIGITNLIVNASILEKTRNYVSAISPLLKEMLECMMCTGFWVGLFIGLFFSINPIFGGAIISLLSYSYGSLMDYLHLSTEKLQTELQMEQHD